MKWHHGVSFHLKAAGLFGSRGATRGDRVEKNVCKGEHFKVGLDGSSFHPVGQEKVLDGPGETFGFLGISGAMIVHFVRFQCAMRHLDRMSSEILLGQADALKEDI